MDIYIDTMLAEPGAHDDIQASLCNLIADWPEQRPLPLLAGGMMMVAPLLACRMAGRFGNVGNFATTRWLLNGDSAMLSRWWPLEWRLNSHTTDFSRSSHTCLHRYEQGYVVEGCGLGGMLVLAEQSGFSEEAIIAALDSAAANHMAACRAKSGETDD